MDLEKLLKLLKENKVKFVIIGATAFPLYGYARATLDVDFFIEPTIENAKRCYDTLLAFGYDLQDLSPEDLLKYKVLIRQYNLEIDLHPFVKGVTFEEVWENRVKGKIGNEEVYFASLEDLIKMKKAAGRAKDLEDLRVLQRLKEEKEKSRNN